MTSIKVGVIGAGFMGANHAEMYASTTGARLVGVADILTDRAEKLADTLNVRAYASVEDLLADPAVDAVSICTNDEKHVEPTIAAFKAGKHVLLEKPITTTLEDADRIISAVEAQERCFLVGHILRFEKRYAEAARVSSSGEIGDIVSIFARRIGSSSTQDTLKGRVSLLSFLGVHDFDLCCWFAASPAIRVYSEARSGLLASRGYNVEDHAFTVIRFANNTVACVESGWILPDTHPRKAEFRMDIIGTKGMISLDLTSSGISICGEKGYRLPNFGHGLEEEIQHFLRCVRGQESPLVKAEDARNALELSLAAQESSRTNRPVSLPFN
jgi:UDP-N-acetylglucosamine 3-dehydrogenase